MGSLRLTLCTGLLVAGAFAPAAVPAATSATTDGTPGAAAGRAPAASSPTPGDAVAVVPAQARPAPPDPPDAHAVADAPGVAHAVTGLVLAGAAAAAVVLLPRARGEARRPGRRRTED
ncbi:hypothetical protein [Streptomyces sp. NPDC021356]|uniref:hypothetical protein n=1 Tax=Streptomyces sp. NPDC021356 TaxID=3154900 RepID=UPI00340D1240